MKNAIKFLGIIAIIAVVGFSFTACDPDGKDNGGGGGGGNQTTIPWDLVGRWGIANPMPGSDTTILTINRDGTGRFSAANCTLKEENGRLYITFGQMGTYVTTSMVWEIIKDNQLYQLSLTDAQGDQVDQFDGIADLDKLRGGNPADLIGTWEREWVNMKITVTFNANRTGTEKTHYIDGSFDDEICNFTWSIGEGDHLALDGSWINFAPGSWVIMGDTLITYMSRVLAGDVYTRVIN